MQGYVCYRTASSRNESIESLQLVLSNLMLINIVCSQILETRFLLKLLDIKRIFSEDYNYQYVKKYVAFRIIKANIQERIAD